MCVHRYLFLIGTLMSQYTITGRPRLTAGLPLALPAEALCAFLACAAQIFY